MTLVLVLCTGNSCRSQMAEGYLKYYGSEDLTVYSAGIETHGVNPKAILVMKEDGVDISHHTSNHVDEYQNIDFDYIVTVCDHAREHCPYIPGEAERIHQNFPDPAKASGTPEEILNSFRGTRDLIGEFSNNFVQKLKQ